MMPKAFLVDDLWRELGLLLARIDQTRRTLQLHAKRIEALRKRVERQGKKLKEAGL